MCAGGFASANCFFGVSGVVGATTVALRRAFLLEMAWMGLYKQITKLTYWIKEIYAQGRVYSKFFAYFMDSRGRLSLQQKSKPTHLTKV